jgi:hypothetical protein
MHTYAQIVTELSHSGHTEMQNQWQLMLTFPVAALDGIAYWWIFVSLSGCAIWCECTQDRLFTRDSRLDALMPSSCPQQTDAATRDPQANAQARLVPQFYARPRRVAFDLRGLCLVSNVRVGLVVLQPRASPNFLTMVVCACIHPPVFSAAVISSTTTR